MQKTFIQKAAICAAAFASLVGLGSCVNEKYEISEERLDLNMTLFQDGLCLPLGSTAKIRLDSVINKMGVGDEIDKFLDIKNGAYSFSYKPDQPLDLSEHLESLNGVLDIDAVSFNKTIDFSLSQVDMESVSYAGDTFELGQNLDEMFGDFIIPKPQIPTEDFTISSDLYKHAEDFAHIDFELSTDDVEDAVGDGHIKLATVPSALTIPEGVADTEEKTLEYWSGLLGQNLSITNEVQTASVPIEFEYKFPKEVKSVEELHVASGAKLRVSAEIINPFFSSGSVTPHVKINLNELFHLENAEGKVHDDMIDEDFVLTGENSWKASDEYDIKGVVLEDRNFTTNDEGLLVFKKDVDLSASAKMVSNGLMTSAAVMKQWLQEHQEDRNVYMKVTFEFVNLHVDDATVELNPIDVRRTETFDIDIPQMNFPQEVKTVEEVLFTNDSKIDVALSASGLAELGGLDFEIEKMVVTFPDKLIVEGGNVVTLAGGSITEGIGRQIRLLGVKMENPDENGVVPAYKGTVSVDVVGKVEGKINTGKLPTDAENDVKLLGSVVTSVDIADYTITVDGYKLDSDVDTDVFEKREMKIEVPKEMADIQGVKIFFKNAPAITLNIDIPEVTPDVRPLDERGLVVRFPQMLKFKDYSGIRWYDEQKHALVFTSDEDFPGNIVLPIDYLLIDPQKDETDGKYYVQGAVEVVGSVGIKEGSVMTKADVEKLAQPGAKVAFSAVIPELKPASADMESYTTSLEESIEFEPLKDVELPEMLASIDQIDLDDVYLYLSVVTGEGFPSLGDDAVVSLGADIALPDFLDIDDQRYENGKLSVAGTLEKVPGTGSAMQIVIDPIKLKALSLDMTNEELTALKGRVEIDGNVSITGASVVMDEWLDKSYTLDVKAGLATFDNGVATDKLRIEKVTGKVDYQLDPISQTIDMTPIGDLLEGVNFEAVADISTLSATVDLTSNLGVPVRADLKLTPYYGKEAGVPFERELVIDGAASAAEPKTTKIFISNKDPQNPSGYDQIVKLDVLSIMYKDESMTQLLDSLKVELSAGTDAQKQCVYEPSADYKLTVDYFAGFPLAFGENFMFEYRDTIALPEETAKILEYGTLALCGEIENSLPLGLGLTARLMDSNKNELMLTQKPLCLEIGAADANGDPVNVDLEFVIGNYNDIDLSDLKYIEVIFTAGATPHLQLREDQFIRASLYALVPKGVSINGVKAFTKDNKEDEENTDNE